MIPVYGFLEGDTLGVVLLLDESDTIGDAAAKLQTAADVRVDSRDALVFVHRERVLHPTMSVRAAGIEPLDRVDLRQGSGS
jgi:hypothetical protein